MNFQVPITPQTAPAEESTEPVLVGTSALADVVRMKREENENAAQRKARAGRERAAAHHFMAMEKGQWHLNHHNWCRTANVAAGKSYLSESRARISSCIVHL